MSQRIGFAGLGLMEAGGQEPAREGLPDDGLEPHPRARRSARRRGRPARGDAARARGALGRRRGLRRRPARRRAARVRPGRPARRRAPRLPLSRVLDREPRADAPRAGGSARARGRRARGAGDGLEERGRERHAAVHDRRRPGGPRRAPAGDDGDGHEGDLLRRDGPGLHDEADRQQLHLADARGAVRGDRGRPPRRAAARDDPRGGPGLGFASPYYNFKGTAIASATSASTSRSTCW